MIDPACHDRITSLPVDVIHRILASLPHKDVVIMATLSTQWRAHWRRIPQLVFDGDFAITADVGVPLLNDELMKMKNLMLNILRVLLLHDGSIEKFVITVPGLRSAPCECKIDQIILYLSNRGLKEFELCFYVRDYQVYMLHSALFSCRQLNVLKVICCELRQPSWFVGFSHLTVLHVVQVILPADFFENFLHKCTNLGTLLVAICDGPSDIQVVVPCLQTFIFSGYLRQICFKQTPVMHSILIHLRGHGGEEVEKVVGDTVAFFASLPALETFFL